MEPPSRDLLGSIEAFWKAKRFPANSTPVFKDGEESVFYKTRFLNSQLVSLHVLVKLKALENSWGFQLCWWLKNRVYSTSVIANMYGKVKTITYNRFKSWGPIKNSCSGFLDEFQSSLNEFHRSDQIRSSKVNAYDIDLNSAYADFLLFRN